MDAWRSLLCCRDQVGHVLEEGCPDGMLSPVLHSLGSSVQVEGGHKSSYKHCYVSVQTSVSTPVNTAVLIWPPKCSCVQQFRSQEMGKEWILYMCSLCTVPWQDGLWFSCFSPCCLNIYQWSLLPCLRVPTRQHKEYFRCGSMLSVLLGPSGWLPVGKPRVPGLFTFGLPPRKARRQLHVPGINLGA